jgi:hypothetical protein
MKSTIFLFLLLYTFIIPLHAQWNPMQTPYGASASRLWESSGRLFCSTTRGSYFSDDHGTTWQRALTNDYKFGGFSDLYSHDSIIIARIANSELDIWEMIVSTNNGNSWSRLHTPDNGATRYPDFGYNGKTILYSFNNKTYRSEDLGVHWTFMDDSELPLTFNSLVTSGGLFFARKTDGSVWGSDSTGTTWDSLTFQDATYEFQYIYRDDDILLVGVTDGMVHYSYDDGETWNFSENLYVFRGAGEGFYRHGDILYMLHNYRIYESLDMAVTWQLKTSQYRRITDMVPGDGYFLFIDPDLYKSYDHGKTDVPASTGIENKTISNFQIDGNTAWYTDGIHLSIGQVSADEVALDSLINDSITIDEMIKGDGFVFIDEHHREGLDYWTRILRISPDGEQKVVYEDESSQWINSDHIKYTDGKLFYFVHGSLVYSEDKGETWLPQTDFGIAPNYDMERHGNALFCIGTNGVLRRLDGEPGWHDANQGLNAASDPLETGTLQTRLFSTDGALFLQLIREDNTDLIELYVSYNLGDSWQRILSEYPDLPAPYLNSPLTIKNIVTIPGYHIMVLRDIGVLISADLGLTWTEFNNGLPQNFGWEIHDLETYDTMAVVSLKGNGFWRLRAQDITTRFSGGKVYYDTNGNGTLSSGEPGIPFIKVLLQGKGQLDFTDGAGSYGFYHDVVDSLVVKADNPYVTIVPNEHLTTDQSRHFGFQLNSDVHDLAIRLYADREHRPGQNVKYYLIYQNLGNAVSGVSVNMLFSDQMNFLGADITPAEIAGQLLRFDIGDVGRLESGQIEIVFTIHQDAMIGALVHSECVAILNETDQDQINNAAIFLDMITGPFDPNDITVDLAKVDVQDVLEGQWLRYMIRFQNVGTSYAEDVIIENTISPLLDVISISNISAIHPSVIITYMEGKLEFNFDGILLPDSTSDKAGSHGFVAYDILIRNNAQAGDTIKNFADIFFDFNLPVRTNTALTVVEDISSVNTPIENKPLVLAPNPSDGKTLVNIITPFAPGILRVFDMEGKLQLTEERFKAGDMIDVSWLAAGIYFVALQSEGEVYASKLVIR